MANKTTIVEDNRLMQVRRDVSGRESRHGKRVAKNCPLTYEERRFYIAHGTIPLLKMLREKYSLTLSEVCRMFCVAAYGIDSNLVGTTRRIFEGNRFIPVIPVFDSKPNRVSYDSFAKQVSEWTGRI